jgi:hypothetical protein
LQLIDAENALADTQHLRASDDGNNVEIICLEGPLAGKAYAGVDYFWLFSELRTNLIEKGLRPLVIGAKRNVFAGGLLSETSLGFILHMFDDHGDATTNVRIFDPVDISEASDIVSFDVQKAHRKALIQKRKSRHQ